MKGRWGQNILSRDQAASSMSLPLSLFWPNLGFPRVIHFVFVFCKKSLKGLTKIHGLLKEWNEWWNQSMGKQGSYDVFSSQNAYKRPYNICLGGEMQVGRWAVYRPSKEENMPVMGHRGHMDKPKLASWETHWYSWKKIREKCLLRVLLEKRRGYLIFWGVCFAMGGGDVRKAELMTQR